MSLNGNAQRWRVGEVVEIEFLQLKTVLKLIKKSKATISFFSRHFANTMLTEVCVFAFLAQKNL